MTVLSKRELTASLALPRNDPRKLVVSPIIQEDQIGPSSIDLRMGTLALLVRASGLPFVDPASYAGIADSEHAQIKGKQQKFERHEIPFQEPFYLHPGTLALVPTLEWLKVPYNMQGIVTARSSWAREGLNIATASFIHPGYCGIVTLELANFGQIPIKLYPGLRLAQIAFYHLDRENKANSEDAEQGHFKMCFEPTAGKLCEQNDPFLPQQI